MLDIIAPDLDILTWLPDAAEVHDGPNDGEDHYETGQDSARHNQHPHPSIQT